VPIKERLAIRVFRGIGDVRSHDDGDVHAIVAQKGEQPLAVPRRLELGAEEGGQNLRLGRGPHRAHDARSMSNRSRGRG
jgi:hypothetical protein